MIILGVKEDRYLSGLEFVSALMFRMFVPTEAALYTRPNLYIRILIIQTNHVCYMNWEKNHLHLICEPSEYG